MKLLVQSDDFGITRGTARGAVRAIKEGIVRNTGLFANMPWAQECVKMAEPLFSQIAFGIDLNAVNGPSLLGHDKVPSLCHEDGTFLSIRENRARDNKENGNDHVVYEELYQEFDAQIIRFTELTGKLPDYIHGHAYLSKTTVNVQRDLARKYHIPYSADFSLLPDAKMPDMGWYTFGTLEQQLNEDPLTYILEDRAGYLGHEYGYLVTHCGELDSDTLHLPFSICRLRDLEAMTSPGIFRWLKENDIELITFKDIREQITA